MANKGFRKTVGNAARRPASAKETAKVMATRMNPTIKTLSRPPFNCVNALQLRRLHGTGKQLRVAQVNRQLSKQAV